MGHAMTTVLILGSGPNVVAARGWPRAPFDHILAINNAYAVRPDWDSLIHPEDFPVDRRPRDLNPGQSIVTATDYVPAQNRYGGFVYAGGTMAFTAGYWALHHHRPRVLAFMGCDMVYPQSPGAGQSHFYGAGAADPLRADVTLQSLEGKSARLMILAAAQGCACVNLSGDESRLIFPRAQPNDPAAHLPGQFDASAAQAREAELGYMIASGRYWEAQERFDAAALRDLDLLWLEAALAPDTASRDT
jgi:hypothetical protein